MNNLVVWGYGGYDDVGNIAEELENPQKQFPRAMIILIFLSIISYMAAFIGPVSLQNNYGQWVDGYFANVAATVRFSLCDM